MATKKSGRPQRRGKSTRSNKARAQSRNGLAFGSKSEFVRARPDKTAQQIVAEAAQQGMELTAGHVYNIRTLDRKRGASARRAPARAAGARLAVPAERSGSSAEAQFRTLVVRIGLDRAQAMLADLESKLMGPEPSAAPRRRGRRAAPVDTATAGSASAATSPAESA